MIAAMMRGLRRPCITPTTHKGFSSGAYAIKYSWTRVNRKGRELRSERR